MIGLTCSCLRQSTDMDRIWKEHAPAGKKQIGTVNTGAPSPVPALDSGSTVLIEATLKRYTNGRYRFASSGVESKWH